MILDRLLRNRLLSTRIYDGQDSAGISSYSREYLFLVQQAKRVSFSRAVGKFSRFNLLLWPWFTLVALFHYADLCVTNTLVRSLINEIDLQDGIARAGNSLPNLPAQGDRNKRSLQA